MTKEQKFFGSFFQKRTACFTSFRTRGKVPWVALRSTRPTACCFVFKKGCNVATLFAFTTAPEPGGGGASLWQALMTQASIPFHRRFVLHMWRDWRPSLRGDHKPRLCYDLSTRQPGSFALSDAPHCVAQQGNTWVRIWLAPTLPLAGLHIVS